MIYRERVDSVDGPLYALFSYPYHHHLLRLCPTVLGSASSLTGCSWIPVFYMERLFIWPPQPSYWVTRIPFGKFGIFLPISSEVIPDGGHLIHHVRVLAVGGAGWAGSCSSRWTGTAGHHGEPLLGTSSFLGFRTQRVKRDPITKTPLSVCHQAVSHEPW